MGQRFAKIVMRLFGWKAGSGLPPEKHIIFLGVPHTCIADLFVSYFFYRSIGGRISIMVKKEFFFWPVTILLKTLNAIPIDRKHSTGTIKGAIDAFKSREKLHLGMAPEGTRAPVKRWKMGFHTIARETGATVYLGEIDWGRKVVSCGVKFECTDDPKADLIRIQRHYKSLGLIARHPEKYVFLDEVDLP